MHRWSIAAFLFLIPCSFAQLDSNSVTVTASRSVTLQPDLATITISVTADPDATLSDVLSVVEPAGITATNFYGLGTTTVNGKTALQWSFSLSAPIATLKTTTASLSKLHGTIGQANGNFAVDFYIGGTSISSQLQQRQSCLLSDLMADARAKAATIAAAAGRTLSGVLAVSGSTSPIDTAASSSPASPNCSITVKFALLGS